MTTLRRMARKIAAEQGDEKFDAMAGAETLLQGIQSCLGEQAQVKREIAQGTWKNVARITKANSDQHELD